MPRRAPVSVFARLRPLEPGGSEIDPCISVCTAGRVSNRTAHAATARSPSDGAQRAPLVHPGPAQRHTLPCEALKVRVSCVGPWPVLTCAPFRGVVGLVERRQSLSGREATPMGMVLLTGRAGSWWCHAAQSGDPTRASQRSSPALACRK